MKNKNQFITLIKVFLLFILTFLLIYGSFSFYNQILEPASLSVKTSCSLITNEELLDLGYSLVGTYTPSTDETILYSQDIETIRHENCHRVQDVQNRIHNSCTLKAFMLFDEMECYLSQKYPDWLYKILY